MKYVLNGLIIIIFIIEIFLLFISYSNKLGIMSLRIMSGSMLPDIEVNDVVFVKKAEYKKGDIITFKEDNHFTTHRIIKVNDMTYTTMGDSNNAFDKPVKNTDVIGKVFFIMPMLDYTLIRLSGIIIIVVLYFLSKKGEKYSV